MNVALTAAQKKFIEQKVKAGQFATSADVMREALDVLRSQEILTARDVSELREAAAIGLKQLDKGETADFTAADIHALGRKVLARRTLSKSPKLTRKRAS